MIQRLSSALVLGATILSGMATPAAALNTRTWVSSTGSDTSGCGPIQTPCRSLQYAHDNTSAGGEIDVKDSAGYGSITITKAISIFGDGSLAGVLASSGQNAITINAGASDTVILRGLTIAGAGIGLHGIAFNSGGKLDIANCTVQNFSANAVDLKPSAGSPTTLVLTNTTVAHNGGVGISYNPLVTPSVKIVIDHIIATDNTSGVFLTGGSGTVASIRNSISSANTDYGFYFSGLQQINVDLSQADENGFVGYAAARGTALRIGRSTAANNLGYGLLNSQGTIESFGDNRVHGNGAADVSGTIGQATLY